MRKVLSLVALALTSLVCVAGDHTRVVVNSGRGVVPIRSNQSFNLNLNSGYNHSNSVRLNLNSGYNYNSQALRLNLNSGYQNFSQPLVLNLQQPQYVQPLVLNLAQPQCTPAQALFLNLQSGGYSTPRNLQGGCNGTRSNPSVPVGPGIVP
jgi:hypothetical protein